MTSPLVHFSRRRMLASSVVAAGAAILETTFAAAEERPAVTYPRATSGDDAIEPDWKERVTITVGADNVFDVYPDANSDPGSAATNRAGNANFGIFPYNQYSPFGFNGRFVYARLSAGF